MALWYGCDLLTKKGRLLATPLFEETVQEITEHGGGVRKLIRQKLEALNQFIDGEETIDPLVKLLPSI